MTRSFNLRRHTESAQLESRRHFLRMSGGCAALSSTALLSQMLNLRLTQSVAAQTSGGGDYKALVCLFLLGGNDSYNMLTPYDTSEYNDYVTARTGLALSKSDTTGNDGEVIPGLLPIDAGNGRQLGIHGNMPELRDMYNNGDAAFVANVGSLVVPITIENFLTAQKPLGLYSHSDLQQHWQSSIPQSRSQTSGWGGRMADILNATYGGTSNVSMNIALDQLNLFQTGSDVVPYVVNRNGASVLNGYLETPTNGQGWNRDRIRSRFLNSIFPSTSDSELGTLYQDLLQRSIAKSGRISIDAANQFNEATAPPPEGDFSTPFPDTALGDRLKLVASAIRGRSVLAQDRQVFFVTEGGWDHHATLVDTQRPKLETVSQALNAFIAAMKEINMHDSVVTFTASDFARTLNSNGSGSDHAWGGNHLILGGSVAGGQVYGTYPETLIPHTAQTPNPLDLGRGRLIPTMSVDEYAAEIAMWFGIPNDQNLEDILPNVRQFFSAGGTTGPLGCLTGGSAT
ncbi:MAG: DUF1501 domain-containing protein [Planctomycetota bacterium]